MTSAPIISAILRLLAAAGVVLFLVAAPAQGQPGGTPSSCSLPGGGRGACATQNCTVCRDTGTGFCYSGDTRVRCPFGVITLPPGEEPRPPLQTGPSRTGDSCRLLVLGATSGVCLNSTCTICRNPRSNRCYRVGLTEIRCPRLLLQVDPDTAPKP